MRAMDRLNDEFFNNTEKIFPDSFKVVGNEEIFLMGVQTGEEGAIFALTPAHAKRLAQHIAHAITLYEKQYGEIKAQWSPMVKSPIQPRHKNDGENA